MKRIESSEELIEIVRKIKRRSKHKIPSKFKSKLLRKRYDPKKDVGRHGFTYYHTIINFQGELINVKAPALTTRLATYWRARTEALFNDAAVVYKPPKLSMQREVVIYAKLNERNFPTFQSKQHLICDDSNLSQNVLLTKRLTGTKSLIDKIRGNESKALEYIAEATLLLARLHQEEIVLADAILGNILYDNDGNALIYDFNLFPNNSLSTETLQSKDIITLCLSAVGITNKKPSEIVPIVLEAYSDIGYLRDSLRFSLEDGIKKPPGTIKRRLSQSIYFRPLFGIDSNQAIETKRIVQSYIS